MWITLPWIVFSSNPSTSKLSKTGLCHKDGKLRVAVDTEYLGTSIRHQPLIRWMVQNQSHQTFRVACNCFVWHISSPLAVGCDYITGRRLNRVLWILWNSRIGPGQETALKDPFRMLGDSGNISLLDWVRSARPNRGSVGPQYRVNRSIFEFY